MPNIDRAEQSIESDQNGTLGRRIARYSDEYTPLGGYSAILAAYAFLFGPSLATLARKRRIPKRLDTTDVILLGIATHKISRIVTKDWVMSPLRAPFTSYKDSLGSGEVSEEARGHGIQRALGELLTCPWCIGPWIASVLTTSLVAAPRPTRLALTTFTAVTISDFLHHAYHATREGVK